MDVYVLINGYTPKSALEVDVTSQPQSLYYSDKFGHHKCDMKCGWQMIKNMLGTDESAEFPERVQVNIRTISKENRSISVTHKDSVSGVKTVTCGGPQGSVLRPLVSLNYVNTLRHYISDGIITSFASDTVITVVAESVEENVRKASRALECLHVFVRIPIGRAINETVKLNIEDGTEKVNQANAFLVPTTVQQNRAHGEKLFTEFAVSDLLDLFPVWQFQSHKSCKSVRLRR
ncbi:hypothetical protein QYM36_011976 [Artemia franciscana]|uniref:Reverse transcriptase domain-containing protein n=1 Tax=Artemia franciscana TaxID=6661 RepID=A0AA88HTM7_ARTSF|nr:hypothetical protein QYM36_011976 [Artemia franciscana]